MFLLCGAALSALAVHAQKKVIIEDESPKGVVLVTIDKAGDEIIRIMNESQMPYIHEPQAPRFLLTDRKEILNSVNSSRKHLEKICSPVFRSQERDFPRTGQNSLSDCYVIRSEKFSMEIIFLQRVPALQEKRKQRTRH